MRTGEEGQFASSPLLGLISTTADATASGRASRRAALLSAAFAGDDDVASDFAAVKEKEVVGELPAVQVPDTTPGWGGWADQQHEPRWIRAKREHAEQIKAKARAARLDAAKKGVVISEKFDKKAAKYQTAHVPFGYDGKREVYEASLRQPLGRQYNTDASFRNLTRPEVLKHAGVILQPLARSTAKHDEEERGKGVRSVRGTTADDKKRRAPTQKPLGVKKIKMVS